MAKSCPTGFHPDLATHSGPIDRAWKRDGFRPPILDILRSLSDSRKLPFINRKNVWLFGAERQ